MEIVQCQSALGMINQIIWAKASNLESVDNHVHLTIGFQNETYRWEIRLIQAKGEKSRLIRSMIQSAENRKKLAELLSYTSDEEHRAKVKRLEDMLIIEEVLDA